MSRFVRRIVALALLAFWLPATAHCSIEAVTDLLGKACEHACSHETAASHVDACEVVESGDFFPALAVALAPIPHLIEISCLACLQARLLAEARPFAPPAWAADHPRDWVPSWTFTLRAALPARAPDLS